MENEQDKKPLEGLETYRDILDALDVYIYICSKDKKIEYMNKRLIDRVGFDATGKDYEGAARRFETVCPWSVNEKFLESETLTWETRDPGDNRWYFGTAIPIRYSGGGESKMAVIRDITARKRVELLKDDFVSCVSHELRTPLAITKEGLNLMVDEVPGAINEKQRKVLIATRSNIERLTRIVDELLDLSKIEAGKLKAHGNKGKFNISNVINQVTLFFEPKVQGKGLKLIVNVPKKGINVYGDEDQINQVFTNLIGNALKFTEEGRIEINVKEKDREVECSVIDTGRGIPKGDMGKIFGKFQQVETDSKKEDGVGLGLSIVQGIIDMHKGKIWVESERGKGSNFTFTLPKFRDKELVNEVVKDAIQTAFKKNTKLSLVSISLANFEELRKRIPMEAIEEALTEIKVVLEGSALRSGDIIVQDEDGIIITLANCEKEISLKVEERFRSVLEKKLDIQKYKGKLVLGYGRATYPDDAADYAALIAKAKER